MQSSREYQGETRRPSSINTAKKQENNRKGITRNHIKKIRNTKGICHPKMGTIKDRNCKDLVEAEKIKKKWKEYTEERY